MVDEDIQKFSLTTHDGVAELRFRNPPVNVLQTAMLARMADAVAATRDARALVIRGEGRCFSAGMDVREHLPADVPAMLRAVGAFFDAVWKSECPVVAAVHGAALGGAMELLLLADHVIAADDARLGFPEVRVGAYPPLAVRLLPRLVSWPRAAELILQGRTLTAQEAADWGLVNAVVTPDALDTALASCLARLRALSGSVARHAKRAMRLGLGIIDEMREVERLYVDELMQCADAAEGPQAFIEKRPPQWRHA